MGEEQDDYLAARRAAFEQLFHSLPVAGSATYWQRVEASREDKLPLEVLSRCFRERLNAGAKEDAGRVFTALWLRIQRDVQFWAQRIEGQYRDGKKLDLAQDLEQKCCIAIWEELSEEGPTFFLEHFGSTLNFTEMHVVQDHLVKEGLKQWKKGKRPTRFPRWIMDSLEAQKEIDDDLPIIDTLADPSAQIDIEQIAFFLDLPTLLEKLKPAQRIVIYARFVQGLTPQEIARELQIGDRAVLYRIEKALEQLGKQWYSEGEEEQHG